MSIAYLSRYLCPLPGCGKYHKNGSKAQAVCEALLAEVRAGKATVAQQILGSPGGA